MTSAVRCDFSAFPQDRFCGKVLLGSWFEKQCEYLKEIPRDYKSTYMLDYDPKSLTHHGGHKEFVWDENHRRYCTTVLLDHHLPEFLENMSTTSDLAYNHMTKLGSDGPNPRKYQVQLGGYEPVQDYAQNYGNITNMGLREIYKLKCEVPNPRSFCTGTSTYHDDYLAPKPEDYNFERCGILCGNY